MTAHDFYVRSTDALPSARAAGNHRLRLRFANATYEFEGLSAFQRDVAAKKFGALLETEGASDTAETAGTEAARVAVKVAPPELFHAVATRGWEYVLGISHGPKDVVLSGMRFFAHIERDASLCLPGGGPLDSSGGGPLDASGGGPLRATLYTDLTDHADFIDPFENVFRALVAYEIARRGGLVLHSAGFAYGGAGFASGGAGAASGGAGYVCFGHSGAGKTTLTGMAQGLGLEILSDELNALVWNGERPQILALPFAGDFGHARSDGRTVDVVGLYRLRQAPDPRILPLSRAVQVAELIASSPFVNGDPETADLVLSNASRLVRAVPVKALEFAKDTRFWETIRRDTTPQEHHV